jgi:hypothetical protein
MRRRSFLKVMCCAGASAVTAWPALRALAATEKSGDEFFVFIHASGGWDVTLWADPRNEKRGIVQPASTENTDAAQVRQWVDAPLEEGVKTFQLVRPSGSNIVFGPGIGDLAHLFDRITVINGIAMNTVSHPDGSALSVTGRHLVGGRAPASSVDTVMANELGREQLFPAVSVQFPSSYVGDNLDRRVVPLVVGQIGALSRSLARAQAYDQDADRDEVTALLSREARDLAARSTYTDVLGGMSLQYDALRRMLGSKLQDVFSADGLRRAHPQFNYKGRFTGGASVNAAFALEAMKRNVVRCVSFAIGGFDTHGTNYRTHAVLQQEAFDLIAMLLKSLDEAAHPTLGGQKLSEHAHVLVVSDFCRTPQINMGGGRDHYPNNSALLISPRFRRNFVFGKSDPDQVLPMRVKKFADGERAITPPDVLATFVSAFGVEPRKYLREGEVVKELLA